MGRAPPAPLRWGRETHRWVYQHHDAVMRTTVTLDPDVESMLRREVRRRGEPFKRVLNDAIRIGLRNMKRRAETFEPLTFDMGKPRVDLTKASSLAADMEDDELIGRYRRSR